MSNEDKKLQKHLVDEMMKVYKTNPDVMIYMQSLMENYEKLEQENKQLIEINKNKQKEIDKLVCIIYKARKYCKTMFTYGIRNNREQAEELLEILGDKENE